MIRTPDATPATSPGWLAIVFDAENRPVTDVHAARLVLDSTGLIGPFEVDDAELGLYLVSIPMSTATALTELGGMVTFTSPIGYVNIEMP